MLINPAATCDQEPRDWMARQREWQARPDERPVMSHQWRELLFLHWRFNADAIQATLPPGLSVDTFAGEAWVDIVPFLMRRIRPTWFPAVPGVSNFQEVNVRTYVVDDRGRPGVWFYSLDANSLPGVLWGKALYSLPYHWSRMRFQQNAKTGAMRFQTRRRFTQQRESRFDYLPDGPVRAAEPDSLEFFLVERYLLFAEHRGQLHCGQVWHVPYPISDVRVEAWDSSLLESVGTEIPEGPPEHALVSRGVDVDVFALRACE